MILCIPGPWADRGSFLRQVISLERGRFLFAGTVLADTKTKDRIELEFCDSDPRMAQSFSLAGQGRLPESCLKEIRTHASVLYVHFPLDFATQRERVAKFTRVLRELGGIAVKVESSGTAHTWETWERRLGGSLFDLYCCAVVLVGDKSSFYSCGMHHFGLPECEVPTALGGDKGADLMNRFNFWRLNDRPVLKSGETFSLAADEPPFRLLLLPDTRNTDDSLFYNPHGCWSLQPAPESTVSNKWKKPEGEPLFVAVANDDEQMEAAYDSARRTFAHFVQAAASPRFADAVNSVKIRIRDPDHSERLGEDRFAYLWLWNVRRAGEAWCASVRELPKDGLASLAIGQEVPFVIDDVYDWMILEGSQAWGGFTLQVLRQKMSPAERLQHDEYTGILSFHRALP